MMKKVVVIGGGNAAQTVAALLSCKSFPMNKNLEVTLLSNFGNESEIIGEKSKENGIELHNPDGTKTVGKPHCITNNAEKAMKELHHLMHQQPDHQTEPSQAASVLSHLQSSAIP